jgi:hypothetical protein
MLMGSVPVELIHDGEMKEPGKGGHRFMSMIIAIGERCRVTVVLAVTLSMLALAGCGTDAPYGSTLTISAVGSVYSTGTTSLDSKRQVYRVSMVDSSGQPMNGIEVSLFGQFNAGYLVNMNGNSGTAPVQLSSSITIGSDGFKDFTVSAPSITMRQISAPTGGSAVAVGGGGSLANGTYNFQVTALDTVGGETNASPTISAVLSDGTSTQGIAVSWSAVTGATSYNLYRTSIPISLVSNIVTGTTYTVSSLVTIPTATPTPPLGNGTGIAVNTVSGSITATSGSLLQSTNVAF